MSILHLALFLTLDLTISTIEILYEEIDAESARRNVEYVKKKLYKLFEKYKNNHLPTLEEQGKISQPSFVAPSNESARNNEDGIPQGAKQVNASTFGVDYNVID
ncbi:hypothetical protein PIB30_033753 [Stylosanthes scabra]|uniref:Uncharacterized protein n=1 Tax=Stylosanthes scabra TaxID=79078 RepID=A0ABU6RD34_9FABA|nr:hypothetical protein [Stylosanthes scabra]